MIIIDTICIAIVTVIIIIIIIIGHVEDAGKGGGTVGTVGGRCGSAAAGARREETLTALHGLEPDTHDTHKMLRPRALSGCCMWTRRRRRRRRTRRRRRRGLTIVRVRARVCVRRTRFVSAPWTASSPPRRWQLRQDGVNDLHEVYRWIPAVRGAGEVRKHVCFHNIIIIIIWHHHHDHHHHRHHHHHHHHPVGNVSLLCNRPPWLKDADSGLRVCLCGFCARTGDSVATQAWVRGVLNIICPAVMCSDLL